jgi:hypothetical protein
LKRGQYLYQENDAPEIIYMLYDGSIQFTKEFYILRTENKDTVHHEKFSFKRPKGILSTEVGYEEDKGMMMLKQNKNGRVAVGGSIKPNVTKKIMMVAKVSPYEVIGAEEVMFDATKRFVSAMCLSKTCTVLTLK